MRYVVEFETEEETEKVIGYFKDALRKFTIKFNGKEESFDIKDHIESIKNEIREEKMHQSKL